MPSLRKDRELAAQAAKGDKEAYRQLVERYERPALALAYEILKSKEDAEDVVQESFVRAFLSLPRFKGESSFYTWFYRIVYNMTIDFKRRHGRRQNETVPLPGDEAAAGLPAGILSRNDPYEATLQHERIAQVQRLLDQLSEEHRAVIYLRELEGFSYEEIARVTGVSKGTVMSRLHYARKSLQRALGHNGDLGKSLIDDAAAGRPKEAVCPAGR